MCISGLIYNKQLCSLQGFCYRTVLFTSAGLEKPGSFVLLTALQRSTKYVTSRLSGFYREWGGMMMMNIHEVCTSLQNRQVHLSSFCPFLFGHSERQILQ